jgi:hypothetical protein
MRHPTFLGANDVPGNNPEHAVKPAALPLGGQGQIVGCGHRLGQTINEPSRKIHTSCMIIFHLSP